MEQKGISFGSVRAGLPTLCVKYPWLVAQNLEDDTEDQIFYNIHDPLSQNRCRIPELLGRCIRGCFHGWVILSNHPYSMVWSLWNPLTSKTIRLPLLILKDGDIESITECCLSSPPDDPTSVLMLIRNKRRTIVFCHLGHKRKRLKWTEMTYAKQLRSITRGNGILRCLTCCNGKVYALTADAYYPRIVVQVNIVVKDKEVLISLLAFGKPPRAFCHGCSSTVSFLKGYCTELFSIIIGFVKVPKQTASVVYLFKLDTNMIWREMEDLKDAVFFIDLAHGCSVYYHDAIASEFGGNIHILDDLRKVMHSYNVKDKTISLSPFCCSVRAIHVSMWECRLEGDDGGIKCDIAEDEIRSVRKEEDDINSTARLLNVPFDVLRIIMECCVGVEYLNLRVTCKRCHLAAPMVQWSNKRALLQTYSLTSPWLMVLDKHRGIITFTDPMSGSKYFMKTPQKLIGDLEIYCSRYGWLLIFKFGEPSSAVMLFNPFTKDILDLPESYCYFSSACFTAPPTCADCMVIGLSKSVLVNVFICCSVAGDSPLFWRMFRLDFGGTTPNFLFSTCFSPDIYSLNCGAVTVVTDIEEGPPFGYGVVAEAPGGSSAHYFLVKYDEQHLVLVMMDEVGESVEVWKLNKGTQEREKIDCLGRYMIYLCGTMGLCMEAKTREMENKIYFPRVHSGDGNIVFYSLETRRYHTFHDRNIQHSLRDFLATKRRIYPHAWIEPSW